MRYEVAVRRASLFVKSDVLNLFANAAVIAPDTEAADAYNSGTGSRRVPFNPFTDMPIGGIRYRLSAKFGKPTGPSSYQSPRMFQIAVARVSELDRPIAVR